jgi:hypothetical protein
LTVCSNLVPAILQLDRFIAYYQSESPFIGDTLRDVLGRAKASLSALFVRPLPSCLSSLG